MVDAQTIGILVTAASVTVAAVYYMFTLRMNRKTQELALKAQQQNVETRQAQLFMQVFDKWSDPSFAKMYGTFRFGTCAKANNDPEELSKLMKKLQFDSFDLEAWTPGHTLAQYFEGISVLVQKRLIDIELVERLLAGRVIWYWDMTEPYIRYVRERTGDPMQYRGMEMLVRELKERRGQIISQ